MIQFLINIVIHTSRTFSKKSFLADTLKGSDSVMALFSVVTVVSFGLTLIYVCKWKKLMMGHQTDLVHLLCLLLERMECYAFDSLRGRRWKGKGKGKGEFGRARERVGRARKKGKERLQGCYCFLHFLRSDSERKNSNWSELIKCQSST